MYCEESISPHVLFTSCPQSVLECMFVNVPGVRGFSAMGDWRSAPRRAVITPCCCTLPPRRFSLSKFHSVRPHSLSKEFAVEKAHRSFHLHHLLKPDVFKEARWRFFFVSKQRFLFTFSLTKTTLRGSLSLNECLRVPFLLFCL